jgi:hypothetical protein
MPQSNQNMTWSPPPKKSEIATTDYSRNLKDQSLKLQDIDIEK